MWRYDQFKIPSYELDPSFLFIFAILFGQRFYFLKGNFRGAHVIWDSHAICLVPLKYIVTNCMGALKWIDWKNVIEPFGVYLWIKWAHNQNQRHIFQPAICCSSALSNPGDSYKAAFCIRQDETNFLPPTPQGLSGWQCRNQDCFKLETAVQDGWISCGVNPSLAVTFFPYVIFYCSNPWEMKIHRTWFQIQGCQHY